MIAGRRGSEGRVSKTEGDRKKGNPGDEMLLEAGLGVRRKRGRERVSGRQLTFVEDELDRTIQGQWKDTRQQWIKTDRLIGNI